MRTMRIRFMNTVKPFAWARYHSRGLLTPLLQGRIAGRNPLRVRRNANRVFIARASRPVWALSLVLAAALAGAWAVAWAATQTDIPGPTGSGAFGTSVTVLSNGNIVVADPGYDITTPTTIADVGAVYLYDGATRSLISTLTGSTASDSVGNGGVTALSSSNFVVRSSNWNGNRGAVTWGSGTSGVSGTVSSSNSLVGSTASDSVGSGGVTVLTNGNYVVVSELWDNGATADVGAVTWGSGTTGISGAVSAANSLVGSTLSDQVGSAGVVALVANGNYVVCSPLWNSPTTDVGAVTWGDGTTGVNGAVSTSNSLYGSTTSDLVGSAGIVELTNGNYVVRSPLWNGARTDVGAVTWRPGTSGGTGAVVSTSNSLYSGTDYDQIGSGGVVPLTNGNYVVSSPLWNKTAPALVDGGAVTWRNGTSGSGSVVNTTNSLYGATAGDQAGSGGVVALTNGNYVVASPLWDNGAVNSAGAVTWGDGMTGIAGAISSANSLVGSTVSDSVGNLGITALTNGNYVVRSSLWNNGATADTGAVTWGNGTTGISGTISASNSLVSNAASDNVGSGGVTALTNGNYVVVSQLWDNGAATDAGAVTWGNGTTGISGAVSSSNSLVGSAANDALGITVGVTALTNGNYVVVSFLWNNGATADAGAATWGNGTTGITGTISASNSLVGSTVGDNVGSVGVTALSDGNYGVISKKWDNGATADVGAVTWGNGTTGTTGAVSTSNSLVGSTASDFVGDFGVTAFTNANYVVRSTLWDNGATTDAGAMSLGPGAAGTLVGPISAANSVRGTAASSGANLVFAYDTVNEQLVVGRRNSNIVSFFRPTYTAIASGNWSASTSWDFGATSKPVDVSIPTSRSITLDTNVTIASLTVASGATLTIPSGRTLTVTGNATVAGSLNISGTLSVGGTYDNTSGTTAFTGSSAQTVPALTYNNLTLNNSAGATLAGNVSVTGTLTLTSGVLSTGSNTLSLGCSATISGASATSYLTGNLKKEYCSAGSFTYPVGTANGYSPATVEITTVAVNPSSLTVKAVQGTHPLFDAAASLKRYWTLTEVGDVTANLTFNYLDPTDIAGNESDYQIFKAQGSTITPFPNNCPSPCVTPATNSAVINGVSAFSDWTMAEPSLVVTAVELVSFSARTCDQGTMLEWQTGYEVDNLGFNVYRQEGTERVRVNRSLIAGSALLAQPGTELTAGRSYAWRDVPKDSNASYWLEEVDLSGRSNWHGPIYTRRAVFPNDKNDSAFEQAMTLSEVNAKASEQTSTLQVERTAGLVRIAGGKGAIAPAAKVETGPAVKLMVKREGFYRVPKTELLARGLSASADSRKLQLYADGQEQPINVVMEDKEGDWTAIEFYGMGLDTPSTDARAYWLREGSDEGKRIGQASSGDGQPGPGSFQYTVERRDRMIYVSGIKNGESENFWGAIVSSSPVDQLMNVSHVDQSAESTLEVAMQGLSQSPHHVSVMLNGTVLGAIDFNGQTNQSAAFSVPAGLLQDGQNTVTLSGQTSAFDVSMVDRIRVTYLHTYTADGNALKLTASGAQQVTVGGFTSGDIRVLDVTDPAFVEEVIGTVTGKGSVHVVRFAAPGRETRTLLALAGDQIRAVAGTRAERPSSWRTETNAADLVIITHNSILESFKPLQTLRQAQGLKVALVDVEDIYDEFSYGNKAPRSIKDFLSYARTNWKKAPRYVLLGGGASYDPRNYNGYGAYDLVPTKFVETAYMETACDDWFADFNADGIADLAVGRLPASDGDEASVMVTKVIEYETSESLNSVTLFSDQNDGYNFEQASAQLKSLIPGTIGVTEIQRGRLGTGAAKLQLLDAIASGQKIVNYAGHGSGTIWRDNAFTSADALALTNRDKLPLFVAMTCLNGSFQFPGANNLAPALLKARKGGAIAVWASSGLTNPAGGQPALNQELYRLVFASGNKKSGAQQITLGEATIRAKSMARDLDIRRTWILFGDPTTRLR